MFDRLVLSPKKRKTEIETGLNLFCFVCLFTYSLLRKCSTNILHFSELNGITHVQFVENKKRSVCQNSSKVAHSMHQRR